MLLSLVVLFAPSGGGAPDVPGLDKVVHAGLFALLGATARWRLGAVKGAAVALVAYAILSELGQGLLLSGRSGDPFDVLADLVGAAAGWLLAGWVLNRRGLRPARRSGV